MAQIICDNLSVGYEKKAVLNELTFEINKGDYLCVIGENGIGKSTLIRTLLGLLPPVSGSITFGDDLNKNEVGYLPQQTIVQKDFPATVMEVVLSGFQNRCKLRPFYNKKEKAFAKETLSRLRIDNLANKCYRELSGGQQQRVLLSRALCATQKILLLDEPASGLDPKAKDEMYSTIEKLNKDGITIIMVSHDIMPAIRYASHILYANKVPYFDTKEKFITSEIGKNYFNYLKKEKGEEING
ncbi:MAG: ABC transporter ATP-binding protein [Clostridia bacterium]|nr:ABC transporter ATP-binding protein [Clostridia bacterium]